MAAAAIILCRDVVDRLRECDPRVVAGCTIVWIDAHVTENDAGKGGIVVDIVTRGAIQGRRQMIDGFSNTDHTVMARRAVIGVDPYVIEHRIAEIRSVVTHGTIRRGWQVIGELADIDDIVVARRAAVDDTGMIIGATGKGARVVTDTAILDGRHVVDRFADRRDTMAGGAIVHEPGVIDECAHKTVDVMAVSAIGSC